MPESKVVVTDRFGPRRFFAALSSKYSLDWWVFGLYCLPAYEAQMVFDASRLGGPVITWFWLASFTLAIAGLMWALAKWLLFRKRDSVNAVWVLLFFAAVGFVRGAVLHELSHQSGLEDDSQFFYRYVTAPTFAVVLLSTLAIVVANIRLYQQSIAELTKERARLRLASIGLKSEIEKTHIELQTQIFGVLSPAIAQLENRLEAIKDSKSLTSAVDALKSTVEDVVRPLSHNVAEANFEELVLETNQTIKQDSRQSRYKVQVRLWPIWSALISGAVGIGPAVVSSSAENPINAALFLTAVIAAVLTVVNLFTGRRKFDIVAAALITILSYSLAGGVFILLSGFVGADPNAGEQAQIMVLLTLLGAVLFALQTASVYRARNLESTKRVNERFELLNSRLRRQVWLDRRHMAGILHGQVQGALYAAAIRLNQSGEPSQFLIENLKSEIQQSLGELTRESKPEHRFDVVLGQLVDMWEDAVRFETKFEVGAIDALNSNSEAAECAVEVIREGINNAVKHGKATKITISLRRVDDLIEILLLNEGEALREDATPGYGSDVLTEYTHRWWRKSIKNGVELGALVVL